MGYKSGKDCKVTLGTNTIVGMGTWNLSGITADQMDASAFGDNWKKFEFGMKDGGQVTFSGLYDPADVTGQEALQVANVENSDISNLRLYVDNTSYYAPCATTGYFSPNDTTGNATVKSWVNITSFNIKADKSGLMAIDFTAKVSGLMVLV